MHSSQEAWQGQTLQMLQQNSSDQYCDQALSSALNKEQ